MTISTGKLAAIFGIIGGALYLYITFKKCSCALPKFLQPVSRVIGGNSVPSVTPAAACHAMPGNFRLNAPPIQSNPAMPRVVPPCVHNVSMSPLTSCESVQGHIINAQGQAVPIVVSSATTGDLLNIAAYSPGVFVATYRGGLQQYVDAGNRPLPPSIVSTLPPLTPHA